MLNGDANGFLYNQPLAHCLHVSQTEKLPTQTCNILQG